MVILNILLEDDGARNGAVTCIYKDSTETNLLILNPRF